MGMVHCSNGVYVCIRLGGFGFQKSSSMNFMIGLEDGYCVELVMWSFQTVDGMGQANAGFIASTSCR